MKQRKHRAKILSFALSMLMLLGIPLPAFAQAAAENAIEEAQNQPVLITDKLTETETYWQNADGSITYESHLEPIRYQDEEGNWHEIVNDVVQVDKSAESEDPFKEEGYDYRSESSKSWVLLDEDIRSDAPIKIQRGAYSLVVKPLWNVNEQPQPTEEDPATPAPRQSLRCKRQKPRRPQPWQKNSQRKRRNRLSRRNSRRHRKPRREEMPNMRSRSRRICPRQQRRRHRRIFRKAGYPLT